MKFALTLYFAFFFSSFLFGQTRKFNNSSVKGKAITCAGYVEKYPCYNSTCRKIGKWVYYFTNGNIERTENYKKIKDCSTNEIPDGLWQFYDEQGQLIKQDEYKDGLLWKSDITRYFDNEKLAGEILVRNGIWDTLEYIVTDNNNLIKNGDFHLYYAPPQLKIGDGQEEIGKQIPFWFSPVRNTPDYYNPFRKLKSVPDNVSHSFNEVYDYVGIILYHEPTGSYSEYITGEFYPNPETGKIYCLKIRIRLSQNSGFYIDRFGVGLSDSLPSPPEISPGISFNYELDNRDDWKTLCALYTALGNEKYITLGRFAGLNETTEVSIDPLGRSEGDYNRSAYYLIDKVEFLKDTSECNCNSEKINEKLIDRINFDLIDTRDSLEWNKIFVLNNIFFEFDKSDLLPASFNELGKLLSFLKTNHVTLLISGHTDNSGSPDYNRILSLSRARSVAEWLIKSGIETTRIQIEGHGSDLPIVENNSKENQAINRRVEFRIIEMDE